MYKCPESWDTQQFSVFVQKQMKSFENSKSEIMFRFSMLKFQNRGTPRRKLLKITKNGTYPEGTLIFAFFWKFSQMSTSDIMLTFSMIFFNIVGHRDALCFRAQKKKPCELSKMAPTYDPHSIHCNFSRWRKHCVRTKCQHMLSTSCVNTCCRQNMSTHVVDISCWHILLTTCVDTCRQRRVVTHYADDTKHTKQKPVKIAYTIV